MQLYNFQDAEILVDLQRPECFWKQYIPTDTHTSNKSDQSRYGKQFVKFSYRQLNAINDHVIRKVSYDDGIGAGPDLWHVRHFDVGRIVDHAWKIGACKRLPE